MIISDKTFWMSTVNCQSSSKKNVYPYSHLKTYASNSPWKKYREINGKLWNVDQWNLKL